MASVAKPLALCQRPGRPGSWDVTVTVEFDCLKLSLEETGTVEKEDKEGEEHGTEGTILGMRVATVLG